ncbi:UNVERIFIED_CONTAM: hypothetical protein GTU68_050361 [Idotea baltica]|nr:hypothetical protein [Idotea baltica]
MNTEKPAVLANDYFELTGKVALITGASSGLGLHFAKRLAEAGCTVVLAARRKNKLDALAAAINANGGTAHVLQLDVQDREATTERIAQMPSDIGVADILINNAGIARAARFLDASPEDTETVFSINQSAVWHISQTVCQQMIDAGKPGSVINIASILGLNVLPGVGSYAVSKAAVVQMTKQMALELARYKIRVNAIAPGYFDTEINDGFLNSEAGQKIVKRVPARRIGELEDLTGILLLLASNKSTYMTGSIIPVDGGHLVAGLG